MPQTNITSHQLQSLDVRNNHQREICVTPDGEVSFHCEQLSKTSNLLSQSDSIGDNCSNEFDKVYCDKNYDCVNVSCTVTTQHENFTTLVVEENSPDILIETPIPSPYISFGDNLDECDLYRESTPVLSDTSVRSNPLASSEFSDSSTQHSRKKKRVYVKKALVKNRNTNKSYWHDVKRKLLVNLGKSHISRSGKEHVAKNMKPSCNTSCRLKCFEKFDTATREILFNKFWELGDHSRQWTFIASNMRKIAKKQWTQDTKRLNVFKFFLP